MRHRTICLLLFFLIPVAGAASEDRMLHIPDNSLSWFNPVTNLDSLKAMIKKASGIEKVDMLCELACAYLHSGVHAADYKHLLDEALELSGKLGYSNGQVKANYLLSHYHRRENAPIAKRLLPALEAEKYFDHQTHWTLKYRVWNVIRRNFGLQNDTEAAYQYYYKPLLLLNADTAWLAHFDAHIWLLRHASIANEHLQKRHHLEAALDIFGQHKEKVYQASGLFSMPTPLEELSINLAHYGEYRRAVDLMFELLEMLSPPEKKSLRNEFSRQKILGRIARIYNHWGKYDTALEYFDKSIEGFDRIFVEYESEIKTPQASVSLRIWAINAANQLEERADVLIKTRNLKQAEEDLLNSISMRSEYDDPLGLGMCYDKMGEIYALRYDFIEALEWYELALDIKSNILDKELIIHFDASALRLAFIDESIAATYLKIGRLYGLWDRHWLAVDYFTRSLALARRAKMLKSEAEALIALGDIYLVLEEIDSTHVFYGRAKTIYTEMGHNPGLGDLYESIGKLNHIQTSYEDALDNYKQSHQIYAALEMNDKVAVLQIKQGDVLLSMQALDEAIMRYFAGMDIAGELDLQNVIMDAHSGLSFVYAAKGDYEKAFRHLEKFIALKNDLFTFETNIHLTEIEARFETEKSRDRILLLEQAQQLSKSKEARSRLIMFGLAGLIIILVFWVLLYLRHIRLKSINEQMVLQHKLLRTQMNPHFIFNSLGSIQSTIINKEPDKAIRYLSRFSRLIRTILDGSLTEHVSLAQELVTIENYLELQRVRFPDKFGYNISVDERLDIENTCIPPMLAQPFIENALEHGFKHKTGKGRIDVRLEHNTKGFSLEIEDNGIGRRKAHELLKEHIKDHKSLATSIIRQRIDVINRKLTQKIKLRITDLFDAQGHPSGTKVMFEFPAGMHDCM